VDAAYTGATNERDAGSDKEFKSLIRRQYNEVKSIADEGFY
jgi:hypothetical protein